MNFRIASLLLLNCVAVETILPTSYLPRTVGNLVCYRRSPQAEHAYGFLFDISVCDRDVKFCGKVIESRADGQMEEVNRKLTCYEARIYCTKNGLVENEFYLIECCDRNLCN